MTQHCFPPPAAVQSLEQTWCGAGPLKAVMGMGCYATNIFIPRGAHQMDQRPALSLAKQMFAALAVTQAEGLYGINITPDSVFLRCEGVSAYDTLNSVTDGSVAIGRARLLPARSSTCMSGVTLFARQLLHHMPDPCVPVCTHWRPANMLYTATCWRRHAQVLPGHMHACARDSEWAATVADPHCS